MSQVPADQRTPWGLVLFMLALPVFSFFVSPLAAQLSRTHEFQADAYACAQSSGASKRRCSGSSMNRVIIRRR